MSIQPVNNVQTKNNYKYNYVKISGYSALALGSACVVQACRHKMKSHKIFAFLTALSTLAHVGIIEYFNHKK